VNDVISVVIVVIVVIAKTIICQKYLGQCVVPAVVENCSAAGGVRRKVYPGVSVWPPLLSSGCGGDGIFVCCHWNYSVVF
jgi:hypothetical protein